jgi:hypothetical protein
MELGGAFFESHERITLFGVTFVTIHVQRLALCLRDFYARTPAELRPG